MKESFGADFVRAHADIDEEGPRLTAVLCRFSREDERYWQRDLPSDHGDDGVLIGGPEAEASVLDAEIGYTHCEHPDRTNPENVRRQYVTNTGRHANPSGYGLYGRPRKPAKSGRRRAA